MVSSYFCITHPELNLLRKQPQISLTLAPDLL
jgi:hypothetical protein